MLRKLPLMFVALSALLTAACHDSAPMYGRTDDYSVHHVQYADGILEQSTRIEPPLATVDQFGLLHVTLNIRVSTNKQQYVDFFITYLRDGQLVEKQGPITRTLMENLPDTVTFTSTKPANDYYITMGYAK